MTVQDFFNTEIDEITEQDIDNAYYMKSLIGDIDFKLKVMPKASITETVVKSLSTFDIYKSKGLNEKIPIMKKEIKYFPDDGIPFYFSTQMFPNDEGNIFPFITYPMELDKTSYVFLGHEFHHALKDVYCKERKIRDRVAEVIPMFYELVCANEEDDEKVSKEILKRRLLFLEADKEEDSNDLVRQLQYFNSYYYALALYNRYRKDKLLVLRLISRVLTGEINTLELLNLLNIYNINLDYYVSYELDDIKEYILK